MTAVGIDVGKAAPDPAVDGVPGVQRFANTPTGIGRLLQRLGGVVAPHVVVEATGGYEDAVLEACRRRMPQRTLVHFAGAGSRVDQRMASRSKNEVPPHSSCGRIPPAQFAADHRAPQGEDAATSEPGLQQ
jgi:hypothetical protein